MNKVKSLTISAVYEIVGKCRSVWLQDQKALIEKGDWDNLIIFDACRYDYFKKLYPDYISGTLLKCWNRGISWTYDWFNEMFDGKYDAVLYSPAPFTVSERLAEMGWNYTDHFDDIIGHEVIEFSHEEGTCHPSAINSAVRKHNYDRRKIIRYMQPHPPLPGLEFTRGKGKVKRTVDKISCGEVTRKDIMKAYEKNVQIAFEGLLDLLPDLKGKTVVTADHGTALGEAGYWYHGRAYPVMYCLNVVPWFEVTR